MKKHINDLKMQLMKHCEGENLILAFVFVSATRRRDIKMSVSVSPRAEGLIWLVTTMGARKSTILLF